MAPSLPQLDEDHTSTTTVVENSTKTNMLNGHMQSIHSKIDETVKPQLEIPSRPYGSRKKMRIAIIGAGISGLSIFKVIEEKLQNVEIVCYEKNHDIGGT